MKKIYSFLLILVTFIFLLQNNSFGQCPGCTVNMSCSISPAQPTLCPDTMPDGYAMQPYDEDVSFYLPAQFVDNGTGYNVTLNQLTILSVTGMPYGLSFQTNAPNSIYYPSSNPPTTEHGCAKICGTPIMTGNYLITVFVEAQVTVLGLSQTSNSSFTVPLTILPNPNSNGTFIINNPLGCAPLTTDFQNLMPSNGNPNFSYLWDFGNGNQSNLEVPPLQYYNTPGDYVVSLQTTIDTLGYNLASVSVLGADGSCDDSPFSPPDFYINLYDGSNLIYSSAYVNDSYPPITILFSPIPMSNITYTLQVWDYDNGLLGGDDHCNNDVYFNGYTPGTQTLTAGALTVSITIDHPIINLTATDTVHVYPALLAPTMFVLPNDSVCLGDSVALSISPMSGCTYQWYNDTAAIYNATNASYTVYLPGDYYCEITNSYGCRVYTNHRIVTFMPVPTKPTFWVVGNTLNTMSGNHLQWYFEGNAIPGGNSQVYTITATGNYFLIASTAFGCYASSDTVFVTYFSGINESEEPVSYKLFPNPNDGSFAIEFDLTEERNVNISVTDLSGRSVYEEQLGLKNGLVHKDVELKPIAKGFYLVNIMVGNTAIHQKINVY